MVDCQFGLAQLTVIIVNWNTGNMLRECLRSLLRGERRDDLKIIVVDNASSDNSRSLVINEFPEVTLINSGSNMGFSKANNLALDICQTPYVLLLNPDTVVKDNAHWKMIDLLFHNPDIGAVGPQMVYPNSVIQPLGLQWFPSPLNEAISILFLTTVTTRLFKHILPYVDPTKSSFVNILGGGCIMVKKNVLDVIGFFDERFFMYGEDRDFSRRIIDAGWKLYYCAECRIIHDHGGSTRNAVNSFPILMKCESTHKLMNKYYGSYGAFLYRIIIMLGSIYRLFFLIVLNAFNLMRLKFAGDRTSIKKHVLMLKWSIGIQSASIKN